PGRPAWMLALPQPLPVRMDGDTPLEPPRVRCTPPRSRSGSRLAQGNHGELCSTRIEVNLEGRTIAAGRTAKRYSEVRIPVHYNEIVLGQKPALDHVPDVERLDMDTTMGLNEFHGEAPSDIGFVDRG